MRSRYIVNRILYYLSDGKRHTISEIAQTLEISYKTVQRHITDLSIDYQIITYYGGVNGGVELLNECVQIKLSKDEAELIINALECFEDRDECTLLIRKIEKYQKEIKDEK